MSTMKPLDSEVEIVGADPMIDDVRRIRAEIWARNGNDLDRLFDELRQVERDYAERKGVFACVSREAAAKVEASWGDMSGPGEDSLVDEVRAIRKASKPPVE